MGNGKMVDGIYFERHLRSPIHPSARTQAQAERAESAICEDIYNNRFNKSAKTGRFSEFVDDVYLPWARSNKASWKNDESRRCSCNH